MSEPKIVVVVQARTGSTRLPNKVLKPLAGAPMLVRQVERMRAAKTPFSLVVATTTDESDDTVRRLCAEHGIECFSGHPTDLLDRHYQAAKAHGADACVKIPSDCPLIDPGVIDRVLGFWLEHQTEYDFVSNLHPMSYPDGNDIEVVPMPVLELAHKEATQDHEREHTTPFIWDQPERFRVGNVPWETGLDYSMSHRFTVDYPEDYAFVARVYDELYRPDRPIFSLEDILALLEKKPEIYEINSKHAGVNWYRKHLDALRTVDGGQTRLHDSEREGEREG